MTGPEALGVRKCRGCGQLLHARDRCVPCATTTVHVITDLGPTDGPGLIVPAQLGRITPREQEFIGGMPVYRFDPHWRTT